MNIQEVQAKVNQLLGQKAWGVSLGYPIMSSKKFMENGIYGYIIVHGDWKKEIKF
jgi:hypothetical protein